MNRRCIPALACALCIGGWSALAQAYASAEILTTEAYQYGRFAASIRFPSGSGVIGSFFLWKEGSEVEDTFWNELDFETVGNDCHLETNAFYGNPAQVHVQTASLPAVCGTFHTFTYEWTPDYVAWLVDGMEVRRETGEAAAAFRDNAADGMQLRFNIWPGDATFGGTFDPSLLPVYQHIDWVEYSSYNGTGFDLEWREDFDDNVIPEGWELATWESPKGLSTHFVENGGVVDGHLVLALTADDALGVPGFTPPMGAGGMGGTAGVGGMGGMGGTAGTGMTEPTGVGGTSGFGGTATGGAPGTSASTDAVASTGIGTSTSSVGGAGGSTQSATITSSNATTTGNAMTSFTATATTGGVNSGDLGASSSTSGGNAVNESPNDSGCACRTPGHGSASGLPARLAGFALFALGATFCIRRRRKA